jgi:hypothetical protein
VDLLQAGSAGVTWRPGEDPPEQIFVTYTAGYVLPEQISTWSASATVELGSWARPVKPVGKRILFEATVGGVAAGSEPTWPTTTGSTIVDGAVTWMARDAEELPANISAFAAMAVRDLFLQRNRSADVVEVDAEGFREVYARRADPMPPHIIQKVTALRYQI